MKPQDWKTEKETSAAFIKLCNEAADDNSVFNTFRSSPYIKLIIDNSPPEYAQKLLLHFQSQSHWALEYMEKFSSSEMVGCDEEEKMPAMPNDYFISGTTMRYVYTMAKLAELYGPLTGMNIVEIGGGYGGQCKIIHDVFAPANYFIYDMQPVQKLQAKFLGRFNVKCHFPEQIAKHKEKIDLAISWCAWSELTDDLKREYLDKIIHKADNFFMGLNQDITCDLKLLGQKDKPLTIDLANELMGGMVHTNK